MRYAIFSDIHGNLRAWKAIHTDMLKLDADVLVCLGDVVGYGPQPEEVLTAIREVTPNFVLGNHDAAAVGLIEPSWFNPDARSVIEWTTKQLSQESRQFLKKTPLTMESEDLFFVHAEIDEPGRFDYIDDEENALKNLKAGRHFVAFVGHTHHPRIFDLDKDGKVHALPDEDCELVEGHRYIVNVGSVGEPRNPDDIRGRYVIYDSDTKEIYFRRIEFDPEEYRQDLAATSLRITPYFLQVVDHNAAAESQHAMMFDMKAPRTAADYLDRFNTANTPKQLFVPSGVGNATDSKPKPMPAGRRRLTPGVVAGIVSLALIGAIAAFVVPPMVKDSEPAIATPSEPVYEDPVEAEPDSAPPETVTPSPAKPPRKASDKKPNTKEPVVPKTPMILVASSMDDAPQKRRLTPYRAGIPPLLVPEGDPPPPLEVIAYWRMSEEADAARLEDEMEKHPLDQRNPGRKLEPLAPNPIPLSGEPNTSARALGVWSEPTASGAFDLSPESSLTVEGWMMTFREKKPIFICGTQSDPDGSGWRLDLKAGTKG